MNDNVIIAKFNHNSEITTKPSTQWNRGQILKIKGIYDLPSTFEVETSNYREYGAKRYLGQNYEFVIPDEYFESGKMIYIWVMKRVESSDITSKYLVKIPLRTRQKPLDYDVDSEKRDIVAEAIVALQDAETEINSKMDDVIEYEQKIIKVEESFNNLTALATTLPPGSEATVDKTKDEEGNYIIFNFGIPKGDKGDKGDTGDTGAKGDTYTLTPQDKTDIINIYKEDMTEQTNQILADLREEVDETMTTMEQHEQNTKQYSDQSVASAESAQVSADRAEQAASQGGYMYFTIEDGNLIMEKTSNVDVDFSIEDGNLYMEVGNI